MLLHFVCPGRPVSGKNNKRAFITRTRATGRLTSHIANSNAVERWYAEQVPLLAAQFRQFHVPTIRQLAAVDLVIYQPDDLLDQRAPDGDNVLNAVFDALVKAGVLADDKYVVRASFERIVDARRPRVEIDLRTVTREDRTA